MDQQSQETKKQRNMSHPTKQQKKKLLEFIAKHPHLIQNKSTEEFSFNDARSLWQKITQELNTFPDGTRRTWMQWRKTWQDMYSKFKKLQFERAGAIPKSVLMLTPAEQKALGFKTTRSSPMHKVNGSKVNNIHVKMESAVVLNGPEHLPETKVFTTSYKVRNLRSSRHSETYEIYAEHEQRKFELKQDLINYKKDYLRKKLKIIQEQTEALKTVARELSKM